MGHVDHGKDITSGRNPSHWCSWRDDGITQAIGASQVTINGREIAFIDTQMRDLYRYACSWCKVTDIVILIVAADDGVMPQTIDLASHARPRWRSNCCCS